MYEIFEKLLTERNITAYRVSKETGVSTATLTNWKKGNYTPKHEKLKAIADYFGVTMEYLMTGQKESDPVRMSPRLSDQAIEIARAYEQAPEYKKLTICELLGVDYKKETSSVHSAG